MEKIEFPWLKEDNENHIVSPPAAQKSRAKQIFELTKPYLPYVILLVGLFVISQFRASPQTSSSPRAPQSVAVVMTMIELPKGQIIPREALEVVHVRADKLTKAQQLKVLNPSQLEKLSHRIVAKKDLAPQSPIFWNDLTLVQEERRRAPQEQIQIFFPKQNSKELL
jgi:hypothetical protein